MVTTIYSRSFLKLFFFLTICLIIGSVTICHSQSPFDSDDEEILFEKAPGIPSSVEQEKKSTYIDNFLDESTLTLAYQFSHGTDDEPEIIDNLFYLRLEYETLFFDNLFFKFDGKSNLHLKEDHIAETKNKNVFLDGNIRETFIQAGYENFSLKIGNQINIWGKADTAAITDVVSPRDNSEFIFIELEDARLGQWMASANFYLDDLNVFVFINPLPETDSEPDTDSRYDRPIEGADLFTINHNRPELGDLEFGIKVDKTISKTDFSIMAGRFFSNAALYDYKGYYENSAPVLEKTYPDYAMAGTAISHAWQAYLFKLELAYKNSLPLQGIDSNSFYAIEEKDVLDAAVGIEYNANDKYQMSFEISNRHIISDTSTLLPGTDRNSSAFYYTFIKDFLNQTLNFEYIFYYHIQEKNRFHHFQLIYDLTDNVEIRTGYACFNSQDKNSLMWLYRNEDRVDFKISFYF